jgi:predicted RNase H-like HicB family nuclease
MVYLPKCGATGNTLEECIGNLGNIMGTHVKTQWEHGEKTKIRNSISGSFVSAC